MKAWISIEIHAFILKTPLTKRENEDTKLSKNRQYKHRIFIQKG